jgi:ferredoxin-nitrate reductase
MTNSERRVGLVRRALDPPGEALPDWRIFARLAAELGFGEQFAWKDEAEVFAEFVACTEGRVCDLSGITHARLREEGSVQWGGERLYADHRYPTPDGRARFAATPHVPAAELPDDEFPLTLTTGRVADHWHTLTRTGKSQQLLESSSEPFVELHPDDAAAAGVREGELARVISRRGEVTLRTVLVETLPRGVAFAPFHWGALTAPPGAGAVNATTNPARDPTSRQPELKALAIRVEAAPRPRARTEDRRLVVVGTGMAGLHVVEQLEQRDPSAAWRVTMLGEEPRPTYNRILLSRLLARECTAAELELRNEAWYRGLGVELYCDCPARAIDLERKVVYDGRGGEHPYDRLVLATGSRPYVPPISGARQRHVFVFRTQRDVERIAARAKRAKHAVVVGGGLLGLEAAAGLLAHNVSVTVVENADRLMPQQLDRGASEILRRLIGALEIRVVTDSGVATIMLDQVRLHNGDVLRADLVVVTAGVRPETSLARASGIATRRGILVDDELRTSAPSVFAVGECAEHRGTVYGLWAPLADQARAAAAAVAGDPGSFVGTVPTTTLKVAGVDVFAGGAQAADGDKQDELVWSDGRRGVYRKLVLDGDRLAGALLVGDTTGARELSALLRSGEPCPAALDPSALAEASVPADTDVVCSCNAVTRGAILGAIRERKLRTVAQVANATRASTGCGSCARDVGALLGAA